jgi:peptide/nickel transport system permease protein
MAEVLGEDYIRTATAKGISTRRVIFQHALRAAIVPVVTIFGLDFAGLLSGTIFTEYIFGLDGVGNWSIGALSPVDFPIISATVLVSAILIVIANLIVDIVYSFIDPRVRLV